MKNTEDIVLFFLLLILPFLAIIINRKWCIRQSKFYLPALSFKEHALVSKRFVSFVYLHAIITVLFLIVQRIFFNVYFPYVEREEYHTFNGDLGMILYTKLTFFYVILFSGILTVSWVYLTKYVKQIQVATVFFFSILATIMIAISFFNKDIFNSDAINPTIFIVVRQLYMIPVLYFGTYLLVFLGDKTNRIIRWLAVVLVANSMLIYVWLICALSILLFNSIPIDILLIGAAPVELNEFKLFLFVLLSSSLCYPLFIYLNWPPMKTIMDWHSTPKKK